MMIHQQPPPKPPLLPEHMILSPHKDIPGHGDRLGRRTRCGAGAEPRVPFSGSYYAVGGKWVTGPLSPTGFRPRCVGPSILCKE